MDSRVKTNSNESLSQTIEKEINQICFEFSQCCVLYLHRRHWMYCMIWNKTRVESTAAVLAWYSQLGIACVACGKQVRCHALCPASSYIQANRCLYEWEWDLMDGGEKRKYLLILLSLQDSDCYKSVWLCGTCSIIMSFPPIKNKIHIQFSIFNSN